MIQLDHVVKSYGKFTAVNDFSLEIPEGKVFGMLGPNGAGKTTLLRMITGLMKPTSGSLTLFGGMSPMDKGTRKLIGYMPQQLAVYPGLSVLENVLFMGRIYGIPEDTLKPRAVEILEMVDLANRHDSLVRDLSGGMIRRVMLASAMAHHPRLLLLDEPTAGVDPVLRLRFWDWFETLRKDGTSIIITTHHISEADRCGEVVFLRNGSLLERGTPQQLMKNHKVKDLEEAFVKATGGKEGV